MQRKFFSIALVVTLILSILLGGVTAFSANAASQDIIRVKLSTANTASFSVYLDGNYSIAQNNSLKLTRQLYTVKLEGGLLRLYYGSTLVYSDTKIKLVQHAPTQGLNNSIWLENDKYGYRSYLGDMEFTASNSCIQVVNHVYLEEYLYGVVPFEMSNSWPIEALKAQAIAARSYALRHMTASGTYDVVDTTVNQVYKGYNASYQNAITSINTTAKTILKYGTAVASTYYSASNGGYTELPLHVWGGDLSYFAIQQDPYDLANPSSLYETVFFPLSIDAQHRITTTDNVTGTPNAKNAENYIKQVILDSGHLPDTTVIDDITLTGVLSLEAHTLDTDGENHTLIPSNGVNNCVDFVMATGDFSVTVNGAPTIIENLTLDLRYYDGSNGVYTFKVFNCDSLRLFVVEEVTDGKTLLGYSISQKRYGHGVGMSQRGAQQRANAGQTYEDILNFYYPGTTLETLAIDKPPLTTISVSDKTNATIICNQSLNIRGGPGTDNPIIGALPARARVRVTTAYITPDWHKISYGGESAYVHKDYVDLDTDMLPPTVSVSSSDTYINGSGNTHPISYTIQETVSVTVRIRDANKKNIRTLVYMKSHDAGTYTVEWDGKDAKGNAMPSGTYYMYVYAYDHVGNLGYDYQILDYTDALKPTLSSASKYTNTAGNLHQITYGIKMDSQVTVRVRDANKKVVRTLEYMKSSAAGTYTKYWDGKDGHGNPLPSGTYYIYVYEFDDDGNVWVNSRQLTYDYIITPTISSASKYTNTLGNEHKISYSISWSGSITVRIRDANKKVVRTLEYMKSSEAGTYTKYWNGKDAYGNAMPSGTYYIYVYEFDDDGNIWYSKKTLTYVDEIKPTITAASAYTYASESLYEITYGINIDCKTTVRVRDANKNLVRTLVYMKDYETGAYTVNWDGKDRYGNPLQTGTYYIYAYEFDDDGNVWVNSKVFTYGYEPPTISSDSKYTNASGNEHEISYSISWPGSVTVRIRDANKKVVRTLEYVKDHEIGTYTVNWDGKDAYGNAMPSGTYYIYVYEFDDDGNIWYSKKTLTYVDDLKPTITAALEYIYSSESPYEITFGINLDCKTTVRVRDANKNLVRTLVYMKDYEAGTYTTDWDGKDRDGNPLQAGTYYIYAYEFDDDGNVWVNSKALDYYNEQ